MKHENQRKSVAFSRPVILEIQAPKALHHKVFRKIAKNIFRNFQEFLVGVNLRSIVDPLMGSNNKVTFRLLRQELTNSTFNGIIMKKSERTDDLLFLLFL